MLLPWYCHDIAIFDIAKNSLIKSNKEYFIKQWLDMLWIWIGLLKLPFFMMNSQLDPATTLVGTISFLF